MKVNSSLPGKVIAGCILLAMTSCNLKEELEAAQKAGEPLHATEVTVSHEKSAINPAGRNIHLTYTGIPDIADDDAERKASLAAAVFFTELSHKKTPSFDSVEVTLRKTISEENKGIYSTTKTEAVSYTFSVQDIKRAWELYNTVVKPFNRNIENLEKLTSFCDNIHLSDSSVQVIQQYVIGIESTRGKTVATYFNGFALRSDSATDTPFLIVTCDNKNIKDERITRCSSFFLQNADKIAGEQVLEVKDVPVSSSPEESKTAK